ncbi:MAG: excinuclease ABC subunit UvrC [Lachnospiraceae bacterium]|nr:excinuclease ABC subunit UvrC [Lachnospiraceae bacterium]
MFNIEEELTKLPDQPGVYIMHDEKDAIIYIGKAVSLTKRVHQYFQPSHDEGIRKKQMVSHIRRFEYIVTDSELEALVLECNLIKEHRPKYNTLLRDDKTYPYIKVTLGEAYPRVLFSRQLKKDKSKYFGPFTSGNAVRDTIDLVQKLYKLRTCNQKFPEAFGKKRPCLNYHMKQCLGVCRGQVSQVEYNKNVEAAISFLDGKYEPVVKDLKEKMQKASDELEFEKAATYRDLLESVKSCMEKQKITASDGEDKDIVAVATDGEDAVVQIFFIRNGKMIGRDHFFLNVKIEESKSDVIEAFLQQFYAGTPIIPKEVYVQEELERAEILADWLSEKKGKKVYLRTPKRGAKEKLVELAEKNAKMVLDSDRERIKREEGRTIGAMKEIASLIGLDSINRMEAYDISNTSGFASVGSMVVFEKGKPKRSDYRKFRLKTVEGPNDYASMKEVLTRRFSHGLKDKEEQEENSFTSFPDVIMMDGGKGQVNIALEVLQELHLSIPVCGMVKDDHHRTRGLYYQNEEIPIDKHSEGFKLVTRLQDEAHRFAIEYHKSLRGKAQVKSFLDDIDGIGPARRKALMRNFESAEDMKNASVEELLEIPEMNREAAENVYNYFRRG